MMCDPAHGLISNKHESPDTKKKWPKSRINVFVLKQCRRPNINFISPLWENDQNHNVIWGISKKMTATHKYCKKDQAQRKPCATCDAPPWTHLSPKQTQIPTNKCHWCFRAQRGTEPWRKPTETRCKATTFGVRSPIIKTQQDRCKLQGQSFSYPRLECGYQNRILLRRIHRKIFKPWPKQNCLHHQNGRPHKGALRWQHTKDAIANHRLRT